LRLHAALLCFAVLPSRTEVVAVEVPLAEWIALRSILFAAAAKLLMSQIGTIVA
jgi:hypothetical protein